MKGVPRRSETGMKKTLFVLSATFLLASPVLAGGWEEKLLPLDQSLTIKSEDFERVRKEMVAEEPEKGFLRRIEGFAVSTISTAKEVLVTPLKAVGQFISGGKPAKPAEIVSDTPTLTLQESEPGVKLDPSLAPDFSLKLNTKLDPNSLSGKSEEKRLANINTSEKQGLGNKMLKVQILLQDIVSTDEK
jgi:hypothetical protein